MKIPFGEEIVTRFTSVDEIVLSFIFGVSVFDMGNDVVISSKAKQLTFIY